MSTAVLLTVALSLLACSENRGSISGTIHVGEWEPGHEIIAQLYRFYPGSDGYEDTLRLESTRHMGITGSGDRFDYSFTSLDPGVWVVGAFVDIDGNGHMGSCEPYTVNEFQRVTVAPNGPLHHEQDVYVLKSGPGTVTLSGTLHLGSRARERPTSVALLDGPLQRASSRIRAVRAVCAIGPTRDFTLHNVPEGRYDLVAFAHAVRDEEFSLYGLLSTNPLRVDPDTRSDVDDLQLWIDLQSPDLGGISGTLTFNAPIGDAVIQLMTFDRDPVDPDARATAVELIRPNPNAVSVPFVLPSLALRSHHLAAAIEVVDSNGSFQVTSRQYRHTRSDPGIPLSAAAPHAEITLSLGLGRVSGDIELTNAPADLTSVFVLATVQGDDGLEVEVFDEFRGSVTDGVFRTPGPYTLFGLTDGTFEMVLVPDVSGDGWLQDEINANYTFGSDPPKITVVSGSRVGADFRVRLP